MASKFPGMDPYLEGYLWPDVHDALAHKIRLKLAPQIQPKYVARLSISVIEDESFESEIGVLYPDVEVTRSRTDFELEPAGSPFSNGGQLVATPAPLVVTLPEVRILSVEIRDVAKNQLVSSIEILSPVNKREPNLSRYREKRDRIRQAGVHLLEIDLLRRGTRAWTYPNVPDTPYVITLARAGANQMSIWPVSLDQRLPVLPVPLHNPDDDALVDLQQIFADLYDEAYYHLSIDYSEEPPPPTMSKEQMAYVRKVLEQP